MSDGSTFVSLQYSHLLIPDREDFSPQPAQVASFLQVLAALGSAPLGATFRVAKSLGRIRTGSDSITGKKISIPVRDYVSVASISEAQKQLSGLDDYDVIVSGSGPPKLAPFTLYTIAQEELSEFRETYGYEVRCCLRSEMVSTCDDPPFGGPCSPGKKSGIFREPITGAKIEVAGAACARFWVEFQFGKWLLPKIGTSLSLLHPSIEAKALECFGVGFAQGCSWV